MTGAFNTISGSRLGWTAGAGVDVALTSNWSARLEYLYVSVEGRRRQPPLEELHEHLLRLLSSAGSWDETLRFAPIFDVNDPHLVRLVVEATEATTPAP